MFAFKGFLIVSLISSVFAKISYPQVKRDASVVDEYYGVKVGDPYRWLEQVSEEVNQFVDEQNKVTADYVDQPVRSNILKTLTSAFDYVRTRVPERHGSRYFFFSNSGTQNQDVLYVQDYLYAEPRVFFDPNTLCTDGSISVQDFSFSDDGELAAYSLSYKGSDWVSVHVRNVSTNSDFPEVLEQVKFSNFEWTHDNKGFFYARYPQEEGKGKSDGTETGKVTNQKIYYHRVATNQSEDSLIADFPEHPDWLLGGVLLSRGGEYIIIHASTGASSENLVYYASLEKALENEFKTKLELTPLVQKFEATYQYLTNDGPLFYFYTNKDSPNYRIVSTNITQFGEEAGPKWSTIVAEDPQRVLRSAFPINQDKLVLGYLEDVKSKLELRFLANGSFIQDFPLEIGTVYSYTGKRSHDEFFFNFVSFLTPGKVFHVNFAKEADPPFTPTLYKEIQAPGVDESKLVVKQVFYRSKDGTKVPMFIIHKKDFVPQSNSPTYIYAYGGFNVNILPSFNPERIVFVQHFNGVYAIPNIRGGGEYGSKWHEDGMLLKKQNSFDDFQFAAEYLIAENYTAPSKIVINGGSNGGFLIGASVNQRPELYGAAVAAVGVMDLLRFQKFTIGYAWCTEYGCSDDGNKTHFDNLLQLSPLHNVRVPKDEKVQYPSVLLMTGDHDDRVVPSHSYKLAAELQHTIGSLERQTKPLLLKVTKSVGHGAGKPTSVKISEFADIFSFLVKAVGFTFST